MRVLKIDRLPEERVTSSLMTGGAVTRQTLIPTDMAGNFSCSVVNFAWGARNKLHFHSSDQILVITSGTGIVATEQEEREVAVGDVAHIQAGEKHWHGAKEESYMSHITITAKDSKTTQVEA